MKKILPASIIVCLFTLFQHCFALDNTISPIGYWKTIDDVTGKPKAIVQISEKKDKTLVGQILKIYPDPGVDENEICTACSGNKHNKRIVGMTILEGLTQNKDQANEWNGGKILDPKNGKEYHCLVQAVDQGQKLNVRGYIGIALFGRSQTWLRVDNIA